MRFDFHDEDVMVIRYYEIPNPKKGQKLRSQQKLALDSASNALGHGICAVITTQKGNHLPFIAILCFDFTKNVAEYEACIFGLEGAKHLWIKILEV